MYELITSAYKGVTITIALTGLPLLITGEVFIVANDIVGLKLKDGKIVHINANYIALFY